LPTIGAVLAEKSICSSRSLAGDDRGAAINQHFPFGLAAGVGGYFCQQLTGDSGSRARLGYFMGRVAAIGPLVAYTFTVDKQSVSLSGRQFHEFDTQNRVRGDAIFASLPFPL